MKNFIIFISLFLCFVLCADNLYDPFDYTRLSSEPVYWFPEEGIYNDTIYLSLASDYGKIFYLINDDFNKKEPNGYNKELVLKGVEGGIIDYNILVILEKSNNNIELYTRTYRIDKTQKYERDKNTKKEYLSKEINYSDDKVNLTYEFINKEYGVSVNEREFDFPVKINTNENNKRAIELIGDKIRINSYLVGATYEKDGKKYTEVDNYSIDLKTPAPPTFGSLFWGQTYRQHYNIKIRDSENNPSNKIYYWIREWEKDELIVGPPLQNNLDKWTEYKEAISIESKYGKNGTMGIAAFTFSKNGKYSEISGPYYFKIEDIENGNEQIFKENEEKKEAFKKIILINDEKVNKDKRLIIDEKAVIEFSDFDIDDKFYFSFINREYEGKSGLINCNGKYVLKNSSNIPVDFDLFLTNGAKIASITLNSKNMNLPVLKKYAENFVDLSSDEIVEYYMPNYKVKYEVSTNLTKTLGINENSNDFYGSIKVSAQEGKEKEFKIRFGSFDKNNKLIAESDDYYFTLDKKMPAKDVSSDNIDFTITHNEKQILKLIPPESGGKIYFRLSMNSDWIQYDKPVSFYPPLYGKYSLKIYTKFIDDSNNERENNKPLELLFDTRAIFVDETKTFSGNGTELLPYNSIDRAIEYAKRKNIKLIYVISDKVHSTFPIKIDSDVIIQAYHKDYKPEFIMDTRSIWRKNHIWFDIKDTGYLELRNIDFVIKSGSCFANIENSKFKLYNSSFDYEGKDDFCLIKNNSGKLGISDLFMNISGRPEKFTFIDTSKSYNILNNIDVVGRANQIDFFIIDKTNYFVLDKLSLDLSSDKNISFTKINNSNVILKKIIYNQHGNFQNSNLFNLLNSVLFIEESDFIFTGNSAFNIKLSQLKSSDFKINNSFFSVSNSSSFIGFELDNSNMAFNSSLMNVENVIDYSYDFRLINSNINISSSIIKNYNCLTSISFILEKSKFEGVNNSIFNNNIIGRSFNFWVTETANISTINSLYYFDNKNKQNAFIYLNNKNYDLLKPVWYSNAISSNVILMENMVIKDANRNLKDFGEKNIFHTFNDDFDLSNEDFFIPLKDSPLLQGGLPEYLSPLPIPEKDFLGRNRIMPGMGIDIGAVQKTGNF